MMLHRYMRTAILTNESLPSGSDVNNGQHASLKANILDWPKANSLERPYVYIPGITVKNFSFVTMFSV